MDRAQTFPEFLALSGKVQQCFGADKASLEEVVEALKADGSTWAGECLAHMDAASPLRCGVCVGLQRIHMPSPSHHY